MTVQELDGFSEHLKRVAVQLPLVQKFVLVDCQKTGQTYLALRIVRGF